MYKISTIIPVYNSEKYLNKCIDSILNQSIGNNNIEIILVNDGSTDNSKEIIKKYINLYNNIIYIEQENLGAGSARNNGLKNAHGKYISFIDSDDWIETNMYELMYNRALSNEYDIVSCNYTTINGKNKKKYSFRNIKNENKNFLLMNSGPCNLLINRSFLKRRNFLFPQNLIRYEDIAVIPLLGINSNVSLIEESLYNYVIHDNSSMHLKEYDESLKDIFKSLQLLYNSWIEIDNNKKYKNEIEYIYIRHLLMSASLRFIEFNNKKENIRTIRLIIKEKFPNWQENKYYKCLPKKQKIVAELSYKNHLLLLKILYNLNKIL